MAPVRFSPVPAAVEPLAVVLLSNPAGPRSRCAHEPAGAAATHSRTNGPETTRSGHRPGNYSPPSMMSGSTPR